jgi:microcystin-dependent protein
MPTFVIGSGVGDNYATFLLPLVDVNWFKSALLGALYEMTTPSNWIEMGDVAVSFAVEESAKMIANFQFMNFNPFPIGMIFPFASATTPPGYLSCDGASYETASYPELFAAIGYVFGGTDDNFNVPDLVDNVAIGTTGDFAIADTGGEREHTLVTDEIPSHSHTIPRTFTDLVVAPGEVTSVIPIPFFTDDTGLTGGDGAHNNMQPYLALNYIIYAGRI